MTVTVFTKADPNGFIIHDVSSVTHLTTMTVINQKRGKITYSHVFDNDDLDHTNVYDTFMMSDN